MGPRLILLALALVCAGCSGGGGVPEKDSMSSILEQAKKDQGITGNESKSKDQPATKANKDAPPPSSGGGGPN